MVNFRGIRNEFKGVSDFLTALGDKTRQEIILRLLEETSCGGMRVNDLKEATGLSRPAISHHLKILREAKIIDYKKVGTKNYYYFSHETKEIEKLQTLLVDVKEAMKGSHGNEKSTDC